MKILRSTFLRAVLILVVTFLFFRLGIRPPAPWSVVALYMAITVFAVLIYVSSDSETWEAFLHPIRSTLVDDSKRQIRFALMILFPLLMGYYTYSRAAAERGAPLELRAVHPAPPASISFRGKAMDVQGLENPLRKEAANLGKHLAEGGAIYIKHCVYCHGDNLDGAGHFAQAFNPRPANFADPGTIAMLQEGYLFWRIAKGGPGLPKESAPWNSVMPAWEDRLSEEEIWKVIMYLYDATGYQPRRWETQASLSSPPPQAMRATPAPASEAVRPESRPGGSEGGTAARPSVGSGRAASSSTLPELAPVARKQDDPGGPWRRGWWGAAQAEAQQAGDAAGGKTLYGKKCALCHGAEGKGDGPGAPTVDPKPRDFTRGLYKIRTTASGQPPTDTDLFRIITDGMPGTSMPGWQGLSERDRWNLVAHLKTFAPEKFREPPTAADLPKEVAPSKESLARGKEMFEAIECNKCHGAAGRGDGPSAPELKDDWGDPIRATNLSKSWTFRGGGRARDIATRLATGLMGTPMPSFIDSVEKPEDIWHVANYVKSLGPEQPDFATVLPVRPVQGEIPDDPTAAFWDEQAPANFPLAGQVIVDPRNFTPSIDMIAVRAVYSDSEVAFHLSWDDPTASKTDPAGQTFADQIALQFPAQLSDESEPPYLLMGDGGAPVYLLRWTSDRGVGEASAGGVGAVTPLQREETQAKGRAEYEKGRYRLVMKRPRVPPARAGVPPFPVAAFIPVAFFAWEGGNGETETKFSMSSWYYLRLEPPPSKARWIYPPLVVSAVFGLEIWGLRRFRRRVQG
ncbi:MAG: c-type cytochrome [candidate division NC10 bacterium]|nr:c-type cytochrome [candidate division NC10 bacterium]